MNQTIKENQHQQQPLESGQDIGSYHARAGIDANPDLDMPLGAVLLIYECFFGCSEGSEAEPACGTPATHNLQ